MTENELSKIIVNLAFQIHNKLGPGLLESVYEEILFLELRKLELKVESRITSYNVCYTKLLRLFN